MSQFDDPHLYGVHPERPANFLPSHRVGLDDLPTIDCSKLPFKATFRWDRGPVGLRGSLRWLAGGDKEYAIEHDCPEYGTAEDIIMHASHVIRRMLRELGNDVVAHAFKPISDDVYWMLTDTDPRSLTKRVEAAIGDSLKGRK